MTENRPGPLALLQRFAASRSLRLPALLGVLLCFLVLHERHALSAPFLMDDYIFLDKVRSASFLSLWGFDRLTLDWYRPWSRELHYWTLLRVFGPRALPFHLVNFALWIGTLLAYFSFARRLTGAGIAALATAGTMVVAAWAVPLMWIACAQDLWMLLFTLLMLHAVAGGKPAWAAAAFALALLSKETAALLPAVAMAYVCLIERESWRTAARRTLPLWGLALAWAAIHPMLGGRLWRSVQPQSFPGLHPPLWEIVARTLGSLVNLEGLPAPAHGWGQSLLVSLPLLIVLSAWAAAGRGGAGAGAASAAPADRRRVAMFAAVWALLGWAPLLMPRVGWHAYYVLAGTLGAWLLLACALHRRAALSAALVGVVVVLRAGQVDTPSRDWGTEWYLRRATAFIDFMRDQLMREHPRLPPHSRLYFMRVPSHVGFLTDDAPSLRVWYGDPTLRGGYYSDYRVRAANEPAGKDFFFRYDSTTGWVEILKDAEDVNAELRTNPRWRDDHKDLAALMARAADWRGTALQYEQLAAAYPDSAEFAFDAGVAHEMRRDSAAAGLWYRRATAGRLAEDKRRFAESFPERYRAGP